MPAYYLLLYLTLISLRPFHPRETVMAETVYKIIELVGTSTESWEKAPSAAIKRASKTLRDLRWLVTDRRLIL